MTQDVNRTELKEKYGDEQVFVLPYQLVENIPNKFTISDHDTNIWNKYDTKGIFIPRWEAEFNPTFQQLIPYFFIFNEEKTKVYVAERLKGDSRLSHMLSLGFGGHINKCDGPTEVVLKALSREMCEELNIDIITPFKYTGTIRDIDSKTNDHIGLIFYTMAKEDQVSIKETDTLKGKWMFIDELIVEYPKFENWSKYIIDSFYEKLSKEND